MLEYYILWAAAFVFFVVLEAVTFQLVSIWMALGSLVTLITIVVADDLPLWVQLIVFLAVSVVSLVATRPVVKKILKTKPETNAQLDLGSTVVVTETVNNELSQGRAKLNGAYWAAVSDDGEVIEEGSVASIVRIEGSRLIIRKKS